MATTIYAHVYPSDQIEARPFPTFVSVEVHSGDTTVCFMAMGEAPDQIIVLSRMRYAVEEALASVIGHAPTDTPLGIEDDKAGEE